MAYFLVAAIDVKDADGYQPYLEAGFASVDRPGIEAMAYGPASVIEGGNPSERMLILKFDSEELLKEWYLSEEYQAIIPIRHANADTRFIVGLPGIEADQA